MNIDVELNLIIILELIQTAFLFSSSSLLPNSAIINALSKLLVGFVRIGNPFRNAPLPLVAEYSLDFKDKILIKINN